MIKTIKTLLVDDHQLVIDSYKNYINLYEGYNPKIKFKVTFVTDTDEAINCIKKANTPFGLVFLDIRIPKSKDGKFKSGEDVGMYIRNNSPETKIIVITGYNNSLILSNILQNLNPDGLLYKSDIVCNTLSESLDSILNDIPFYSSTILKLLRKKISSKIVLDRIDKQLLNELSKGTKTKDLPKALPLSRAGIEKRRRNLKELFGVTSNDSDVLISSVIKKGFL
ncbi:response regulator [Flavivirga aquimarina]|uniref:Response regulator n=1 Tax=Flavivirga aquimarina TaxID=2027862 RepID=A0ABT8W7B7_9FLAO|nr:response regulator [Flavivirga aquimarina]MDO5968952.1 response regulator [Flavivirga aquimarina]